LHQYSRRQFLKISGISIFGSQLAKFPLLDILPDFHQQGRALTSAPVHLYPDENSATLTRLWPDSVVRLLDCQENWYRFPGGFVHRHNIQPMTPLDLQGQTSALDFPFWGEVVGPVAVVREWCAADAPLVTRIGHGGVALITGALSTDYDEWYQLADENGQALGWVQAVHWRATTETSHAPFSLSPLYQRSAVIDLKTYSLTAFEDNAPVLRSTVAKGSHIPAGVYVAQKYTPGGKCLNINHHTFHAVPWMIRFGDQYEISSVYWHNQFGSAAPGSAVQVTPLLGKWLYHWLREGDLIQIIS
jgi:hypothetical protein